MKPKQKLDARNRNYEILKQLLIGSIVFLGLVCLYYGSSFAPHSPMIAGGADGEDPSFGGFFIKGEGQGSGGSISIGFEQLGASLVLKTMPTCHITYSEMIPCLDRNLMYRMKWKLNLTLMEHYERHCPPPERRCNCLIPPPVGYKILIRWPASRDEVWKVNIPHTHLAKEKSDQNWMVVNEDKINFLAVGLIFMMELTST